MSRFSRYHHADFPTLQQQEDLLLPELGEELTRRQQYALIQRGAAHWNQWYSSVKRRQPALLTGLLFEHMDLTGFDFSGALLDNTSFVDCALTDVKFYGATAQSGVRFIKTSCAGTDFYGSRLNGTIKDVTFTSSSKRLCRLTNLAWNGSLEDTDLEGQDLHSSSFNMSMGEVSFRNADLQRVNFTSSLFLNVDFTRAQLSWAKFREVETMSGVIWEKAVYNYRTTFPAKFDTAAVGLRKGRGQEGVSFEETEEKMRALERYTEKFGPDKPREGRARYRRASRVWKV